MQRMLWFFVVALLAVDVALLVQRSRLSDRFETLERSSASARLKTSYAQEEEALLTVRGRVPETFPRARVGTATGDTVQFVLLASVDNCTNSVEDEVAELNEIQRSGKASDVQGFFVDEDRPEMARRFIRHLSPAPEFPVSVRNVLAQLPEATTPVVLVIHSRNGTILDAHKPIAEDLAKRKAFYARWTELTRFN